MALPGGCLVSFTPDGGVAYTFAAFRTDVPTLSPTTSRGTGLALNSAYPVNRDGPIAKFSSLRITWKNLLLSTSPTNPYADIVSQADTLWHDLMIGSSQVGTVIAYVSGAAGSTVTFKAWIVPTTIQFVPQQPRHVIPEITFEIASPFS